GAPRAVPARPDRGERGGARAGEGSDHPGPRGTRGTDAPAGPALGDRRGRGRAPHRSRADRWARTHRSRAPARAHRAGGRPDRREQPPGHVVQRGGPRQRRAARAGARQAGRRDPSRRPPRDRAGTVSRPGRRRARAGTDGGPGTRSAFPLPPSPAVHGRRHGPRRLGRVSVARLDCKAMIYVCVPAHNEARTVGLVLWKVRQVFTAFPREYQLLVADDASSDGTAAVLASYAKVLPLSIVTHRERRGYARSLEELLRLALQRTDRAKRDCAITLHADFVHSPECMEEMVKRIESGADLVVAEQREQPWRQLLAAWQARAVIRAARTVGVVLAVCAAALRAQSDSARSDSSPHDSLLQIGEVAPAVPFPVGERLVYQAKFGIFNVGT